MGNHSGLLRMKIEKGNEDLRILMKLGGKELNLMVLVDRLMWMLL